MKRQMSVLAITVFTLVLVLTLSTPAQAVSCAGVTAWAPNIQLTAGELVTFGGQEFKTIQSHTTLTGWEPPNVPALFSLVGTCSAGGTSTPTPTATATATATTKPTATATPTATVKPTATPTATAVPTSTPAGGCNPPWNSTTAYHAGDKVSLNGINYTAAFFSQNQSPATNNGPAGSGQPWMSNGPCGGVSPTPTATPTPTSTVKPTVTPTGSATPTGGGGGTTVTCTAPQWDSTTAFSGGAQVQFDGFLWQAKFFQQGTSNTPTVDENGGWEIIGICGQIPEIGR